MAKPNGVLEGHTDVLSVMLYSDEYKQVKLTITEFRGENYLAVREWYKDFDEKFYPSNNGVTLPYTLDTTSKLFHSLKSLLSEAETLSEVDKTPLSLGKELKLLHEIQAFLGSTDIEVTFSESGATLKVKQ